MRFDKILIVPKLISKSIPSHYLVLHSMSNKYILKSCFYITKKMSIDSSSSKDIIIFDVKSEAQIKLKEISHFTNKTDFK